MNATAELTVAPKRYFSNAWMSPEGEVHEVAFESHHCFAREKGISEDEMLRLGWVKLSGNCWYGLGWDEAFPVNQRQYDYIFDWHIAKGREFHSDRYTVK